MASKQDPTKPVETLPDEIYKQIWTNLLQSDFEVRYYRRRIQDASQSDQVIRIVLLVLTSGVSTMTLLQPYPVILKTSAWIATLISGIQNIVHHRQNIETLNKAHSMCLQIHSDYEHLFALLDHYAPSEVIKRHEKLRADMNIVARETVRFRVIERLRVYYTRQVFLERNLPLPPEASEAQNRSKR